MSYKVKVTCLKCKESDVLEIDDRSHTVLITEKIMLTPFRSFRWRRDLKWGFLCQCGNDNRLAPSEEKDFDKLVAGDPLTLKRIIKSLKIPDEKQFKMEPA